MMREAPTDFYALHEEACVSRTMLKAIACT